MNKYIQNKINKEYMHDAKKAATVAFNQVLKTDYNWPYIFDDNGRQIENHFNVVPMDLVHLLVTKRLATEHPKKLKYKEVQEKFDEQFPSFQQDTALRAHQDWKNNMIGLSVFLVFIVIFIGWLGYKLYQQHQDTVYWQTINTPTSYNGNGYKIVFPCSDVKNVTLLNDADFNTVSDSCMYFGGSDHSALDSYTVQTSRYLSNKYNISEAADCSDYTDDTTNIQYHAIYHEKRSINGVNIYICGWDSKIVNAKIINNDTVYTLSVIPSDSTTTYKKLNDFISTFQFLSY